MALVPDGVETLVQHGCDVVVERGAGSAAGIFDDVYGRAGASVGSAAEVVQADVVVSVRDLPPGQSVGGPVGSAEVVFVGVFDPLWVPQRAQRHATDGTTAFSLDLVPRITRAQTMDVLSSMGTIAGYESVLLAASRLPQMFPLMMTAAGTLAPARVLVLGAGVAGLQAIATSRRLGALVEGYDVRPAAVEQIRSMGARAVELDLPQAGGDATSVENAGGDATSVEDAGGYATSVENAGGDATSVENAGGDARAQNVDAAGRQQELLAPYVAAADVVITTAAIPGRASPLLITAEMVDAMAPGSVVVDLASERGGNCAVAQSDVEVDRGGVTVLAPTDLVSRCARHASQMFSRNLVAFLRHLAPDGEVDIRADDEIVAAMLVARGGDVVHPGVAAALEPSAGKHEATAGG